MNPDPIPPYRDVDAVLTDAARRHGDRVFVESINEGARLTFAELDAASNRVAHLLAERGIQRNDRVSVLLPNCLEFVVLFFGVQRYGASINPINAEVNAKNVTQILHDVEPRLVVVDGGVDDDVKAAAMAAGCEAIPCGDPAFADDWSRVVARYSSSPLSSTARARGGGPHDIAIINYTSGTTATPKGVCISHEAWFYMCCSTIERFRLTEADRLLEYRAFSWESAQLVTLGPALYAGAMLAFAPRFSRTRFFGWLKEYEVTIAAGVPTVISMLLSEPPEITGRELPALRFMTSSAAALSVDKQVEFEERFGIQLLQGCGITEGGIMAWNPPDAPRRGSIGQSMAHITLEYLDENGEPCPRGVEGELTISGRQMASGYLIGRGQIVPITDEDGRFRTGDLGRVSEDGYYYITGRKKELIIRGGVNIAPLEISTALLAHPSIVDAATIGVPDELYGEAIVSFVVARPGQELDRDALFAHCRTRLSEFKMPQAILVLSALPKSDRGKLVRDGLLSLWRAQLGPRPPERAAPPLA
jgi:acyl-coenzyme A synthetase/AMP-(fatty) acid ligase